MNVIHKAIIDHMREVDYPKLAPLLALPDVQIMHRMFFNHRGERGMRLTTFGLHIMRGLFQAYEINVPKDEVQKPAHLLYLDQHASLPYYCDDMKVVVFDHVIGIKLRLVDGRLSTLVDIETD